MKHRKKKTTEWMMTILTLSRRNQMVRGISIRSQPWCTKVIADFDEIFSVCRAFNPKLIDKKNFSKRLCFDGDKWKIL